MSVIDKLASSLNRSDEIPNQELAQSLAASEDAESIQELVDNLTHLDKAIRSDCIKVLYEIGQIKPALIAPYVDEFAALLTGRDNRLVWGGMTALGQVVSLQGAAVWSHVDTILDATANGSVITQDWGVRVLAALAAQDGRYAGRIIPFLQDFLNQCPPKDLPRHAESCLVAIDTSNSAAFRAILEARMDVLKPAQAKRVEKVLRQIGTVG